MMSQSVIKDLSDQQAKKARKAAAKPYVATCDGDREVTGMPNFGSYRPDQWEMVDTLFVDSSGYGAENEPALTLNRFLAAVKKGSGYAIVEEGQFQCVIGVFKKLDNKADQKNWDNASKGITLGEFEKQQGRG